MSGIATAVVAGGVITAGATYLASKEASSAQAGAAREGTAESRRQFDEMQRVLAPYIEAGTGALGAQEALLGLEGPEAQQEAISGIESSPLFGALAEQGEGAILQQASATGGLRGGNIQGALAQFRPQLLNQQIQQRFANLSGITQQGQASAAGVGAGAIRTGENISNLIQQGGASEAGLALSRAQQVSQLANLPAQALGAYYGAKGGF